MGRRIQLCVGWVGVAACVAVPEVAEIEQHINVCPVNICGFNSPEIDRHGFHDMNVFGIPNSDNFAITNFSQRGVSYQMRVTEGRIYGDSRWGTIGGQDLVGATIWLDRLGQPLYAIRISAVGSMTYGAGRPEPVETYVLEYALVSNGVPNPEWKNVCTGAETPGAPQDPELRWFELLGQPMESSIVFEGDRIDMQRKTMSDRPDRSWFNIGCAGHTIAKLHLTRNSTVGQGGSAGWRWAERQATLKLLTADYCGDGTAFTVAGQALVWMGGDVSYYMPPTSLEARWTENGAYCIHQPRMLTPTTPEGAVEFPDIWTSIRSRCAIPLCRDTNPDSYEHGLRVSGNR